MRVTRRRTVGTVVGICTLAAVWAPSFIAQTYVSDAQPISFLTRPDKGWRFLADSARISRRAKLGTEGAALSTAKRFWRRTSKVELVYLERPVTIPVPPGGLRPPTRTLTVRPRSRLTWFVHGRIGPRANQIIGLIDYRSGRVIWDVRAVTPGFPR